MALEDRQREVASIPVAVVERQRGEGRALPAPQASHGLFERDEFVTHCAHDAERLVEKLRRDLQQSVRREPRRRRPPRPDVMQREDHARPARRRPDRLVQTAGAERGETGADQLMFQRHALRLRKPRRSAGILIASL